MKLRPISVDYDIVGQEHHLADNLNNQQLTPGDLNTSLGEHSMGQRYGQISVYTDSANNDVRVYYDEIEEKWLSYDHVEDYCYV